MKKIVNLNVRQTTFLWTWKEVLRSLNRNITFWYVNGWTLACNRRKCLQTVRSNHLKKMWPYKCLAPAEGQLSLHHCWIMCILLGFFGLNFFFFILTNVNKGTSANQNIISGPKQTEKLFCCWRPSTGPRLEEGPHSGLYLLVINT